MGNSLSLIPPKPGETKSPPSHVGVAGAVWQGPHTAVMRLVDAPSSSGLLGTWKLGSCRAVLCSRSPSCSPRHPSPAPITPHSTEPLVWASLLHKLQQLYLFFRQGKLKEANLERDKVSDGPTGVRLVHAALNTHLISAPRHTAGPGFSLRKLSIKKSASLQCHN